jgi:hypothetical protein
MRLITFFVGSLIVFFPLFLFGQEKIAVLPFRSVGIDSTSAKTAYLLLFQEVEKSGKYQMVPESRIRQMLNSSTCNEISCALDIGKGLNATKVVFSSLNRLGEKIILQYSLVDVQFEEVLISDNMTASYIEDLDQVVKRVALSIADHVPVKKTAEVGLITEQESLKPNTRGTKSSWGFTFGHIYPQHGYDDKDRIFAVEIRTMYEMEHFAVTGLFAIRKGFAFGVGGLYLFSRKDFSPYMGLGTGFHIVAHDNTYEYSYPYGEIKRNESGIMVNVRGGLLAFRTYHFHVMANLEYSLTFNDFDDQGIIFTLGLLF